MCVLDENQNTNSTERIAIEEVEKKDNQSKEDDVLVLLNELKEKENSLLNTAFNLFISKGVSKTSVSDITDKAGVAKGTFYLYFKDKYDLRNKLICHQSSMLFKNAIEALNASGKKLDFEEKIIFIADNIIDQLSENKSLLTFISKNLSWGIFKNALFSPTKSDDIDFKFIYAIF